MGIIGAQEIANKDIHKFVGLFIVKSNDHKRIKKGCIYSPFYKCEENGLFFHVTAFFGGFFTAKVVAYSNADGRCFG
jgi:hypothetical protein